VAAMAANFTFFYFLKIEIKNEVEMNMWILVDLLPRRL